MQHEVFGVSLEFRPRVLKKRGFFETLPFSHYKLLLYHGVWFVDYAPRQGYKISVVMAPCER
jgi:hypothetical protein